MVFECLFVQENVQVVIWASEDWQALLLPELMVRAACQVPHVSLDGHLVVGVECANHTAFVVTRIHQNLI